MAFGAGGQPLPAMAFQSTWLTPSASEDAAGTVNGKMQRMLTHQAKEAQPIGGSDQTAKRGQLSPEFVCWLMGYPAEWMQFASSATQSTRARRRSSSRRSSKPKSPMRRDT
jgi:hypothetical protein